MVASIYNMNLQPAEHYRNRIKTPDAWLIDHLLKRENLGFVVGRPKRAHKSWLMLDMAIALSRQEAVWQVPTFTTPRPQRIAYFSQEDAEDDLHDRLAILYKNRIASPHDANLWIAAKNFAYSLSDTAGFQLIANQVNHMTEKYGSPDLVIFDTLRRTHYADENDSTEMSKVLQNIEKMIQGCHCAVLFAHHTKKGSADAIVDESEPSAARGSTALFGAADVFVNVMPAGPGEVRLVFTAKRCREPQPINLTLDLKNGTIQPSAGQSLPQATPSGFAYRNPADDARDKILDVSGPITAETIHDVTNIDSRRAIYKLAEQLVTEGLLKVVGTNIWETSTPKS